MQCSAMKLNVGCGGSKYTFLDLECEVNSDVQKPRIKIPNFILSDICYLPFKDKSFDKVFAFNVARRYTNVARRYTKSRTSDSFRQNLKNQDTSDLTQPCAVKNRILRQVFYIYAYLYDEFQSMP
jgi:hypothetical protein